MSPRFSFLLSATTGQKFFWLLLAFSVVARSAVAQTAFTVEYEGTMHLVRQVKKVIPCIEVGGKMVPVSGVGANLDPASAYLPFSITITKIEGTFVQTSNHEGTRLDFSAEFESPVECKNAFLVMEVRPKIGKRLGPLSLFCHEIGPLRPGKPQKVRCNVAVVGWFGEGAEYVAHVFDDGVEARNSLQVEDPREQAMTKAIAERIAGLKQSEPALWSGSPPGYPMALLASKIYIAGEATVLFRISKDGFVRGLTLKSATHRAFGEVVLHTVRTWRFLPKVENGQAVETRVEFPFKFSPPENSAK